jgi:hypothetical protein
MSQLEGALQVLSPVEILKAALSDLVLPGGPDSKPQSLKRRRTGGRTEPWLSCLTSWGSRK